jgi:hypothetical protein
MHSPLPWRSLSKDRRHAFFGAVVWGIFGVVVLGLASDSGWRWIGVVLLALAAMLAVAGATASDAGLRRVIAIVNIPWPL